MGNHNGCMYAGVGYESCVSSTHSRAAEVLPPLAIPCKPLVGVCLPAIGLEIGLREKKDWFGYVQPIAQAINQMYQKVFLME